MSRKVGSAVIFAVFFIVVFLHFTSQSYFQETTQWHHLFLKFLLIPVIFAAFMWGWRGGLLLGALSAGAALVDLVRWTDPGHTLFYDKIAEMFLFVALGPMIGYLVERERLWRDRNYHAETQAKKAYRKSILDPLTHAFNRRFMEKILRTFWRSAQEDNKTFSLLMLDLNHFKKINDEHGHPAGDRVLRSTVETIFNHTRKNDFVCRYGGDEFLVILPGCNQKNALSLAKRLRYEFSKLTFSHLRSPFKADFSIGILEYRKDIPDMTAMMQQLDVALYQAKREESQIVLAS
ncbi:MAG: GGDEF domain-containing protein [bacterium]|nr:GGDEF domain-containing protein [bacterium]